MRFLCRHCGTIRGAHGILIELPISDQSAVFCSDCGASSGSWDAIRREANLYAKNVFASGLEEIPGIDPFRMYVGEIT